jgi:hypothetical protein
MGICFLEGRRGRKREKGKRFTVERCKEEEEKVKSQKGEKVPGGKVQGAG